MSIAYVGMVVCLLTATTLLGVFIAVPLIKDIINSGDDHDFRN